MMSNLHELIPGTEFWPHFVRNRSEQFEARVAMVQVQESSSIFLQGMAGSRLPIAIAHGEGHAEFESEEALLEADLSGCVSLRFVDNHGKVTEAYPANQRVAARHHRAEQPRRSGHHHDAAPRAGVPRRAEFLAPGRLAGRRRLAAHVPQRPGLGGLIRHGGRCGLQLVARPSSRGSPGLSRRHLAALYLRGFGFASRCPADCRNGLTLHATRERLLLLCRCGRSADLPYCDGSHALPPSG